MAEPKSHFREWLEALSPPWLRGVRASELWETLGLSLDAMADASREAVKARFPTLAPVDALGAIGADRLLERYSVQGDAEWRAWVVAAWDLWTYAGTTNAVERALHEAGFANATVHWALGSAPPDYVGSWPPGGDLANWSRFWIWLAEPWPFSWEAVRWGDGHKWGTGWTWGSTATVAEINYVRSIARKWKPAHTVCEGIFVPISGYRTLLWKGR